MNMNENCMIISSLKWFRASFWWFRALFIPLPNLIASFAHFWQVHHIMSAVCRPQESITNHRIRIDHHHVAVYADTWTRNIRSSTHFANNLVCQWDLIIDDYPHHEMKLANDFARFILFLFVLTLTRLFLPIHSVTSFHLGWMLLGSSPSVVIVFIVVKESKREKIINFFSTLSNSRNLKALVTFDSKIIGGWE